MNFTRKKIVVATSSVLVLSLGGIGLAYWTSTGSADSHATAGTSSNVTVTAVDYSTPLSPGDTAALSGTISADKPTRIHSITATVSTTTDTTNCPVGNFSITTQPTLLDADITSTATNWSGGVLTFLNTSSNQDLCKGVGVTVHYVANPS